MSLQFNYCQESGGEERKERGGGRMNIKFVCLLLNDETENISSGLHAYIYTKLIPSPSSQHRVSSCAKSTVNDGIMLIQEMRYEGLNNVVFLEYTGFCVMVKEKFILE